MYWADGTGVAVVYRRQNAAWHRLYGDRWTIARLPVRRTALPRSPSFVTAYDCSPPKELTIRNPHWLVVAHAPADRSSRSLGVFINGREPVRPLDQSSPR